MFIAVARLAACLIAVTLIPCGYAGQTFALDSTKGLQPHDVTVDAATYQGRKAVRVMPAAAADAELTAPKNREGGGIVVLPGHRVPRRHHRDRPRRQASLRGASRCARLRRCRVPRCRRPIQVRSLLYPPHQWPRRRPASPEPLGAVHLHARLRLVDAAQGRAGTVRVVRGPGAGRVDKDQGGSKRHEGATLRQRRAAACSAGERSQTRRHRRRRGAVDRIRNRGVLQQSADIPVHYWAAQRHPYHRGEQAVLSSPQRAVSSRCRRRSLYLAPDLPGRYRLLAVNSGGANRTRRGKRSHVDVRRRAITIRQFTFAARYERITAHPARRFRRPPGPGRDPRS